MYGCVVSDPRPRSNKFDFTIKWDMSRLPDGFPIAQYPLCASVSNTGALKLQLHLDINRAKTGKYTFT